MDNFCLFLDGYDGITAVGNAYESLAHMSWAYSDLGVFGASFSLEVFLKTRVITPDHIRYLGDKKDLDSLPTQVFSGGRPDLSPSQRSTNRRTHLRLADDYVVLAQKGLLINQMHSRLKDRGLLIAGGGLCASTAAVNILHALMRYSGLNTRVFQENPDMLIDQIVKLSEKSGIDARSGLPLHVLEPILKDLALDNGVKISTSTPNSIFSAISVE